MRLVFEHPWVLSFAIASIGFGFLWVGLREDLMNRVKVGGMIMLFSLTILLIGIVVETPTEHAKFVVHGFVDAATEADVQGAMSFITEDVVLIDDWKGGSGTTWQDVRESIIELHRRHTISYSTVLRLVPIEREEDVLVELSLFSRVTGIGTVPSRWRILVKPVKDDGWKIYSIDAIEIAGRSYR
jgi:hypothetical protein